MLSHAVVPQLASCSVESCRRGAVSAASSSCQLIPSVQGSSSIPRQLRQPRLPSSASRATRVTASATATAELSTYNFPSRRPEVLNWLDECLQDIVKHLSEAPLLELVHHHTSGKLRLERKRLSQGSFDDPEAWRHLATQLTNQRPEVAVLVRRLPSLEEVVSPGAPQSTAASEVHKSVFTTGMLSYPLSGFGSASPQPPPELSAADWAPRNGEVGRTCTDRWPSLSSGASSSSAEGPCGKGGGLSSQGSEQCTAERQAACERAEDYWGVVVQSRYRSSAEGCYVLKTVRHTNVAVGCECTYYTLTRVE